MTPAGLAGLLLKTGAADAPALFDPGGEAACDYAALSGRVDAWRGAYAAGIGNRPLVLVEGRWSAGAVAAWIGAWAANGVVALAGGDPAALTALAAAYRFDALVLGEETAPPEGYRRIAAPEAGSALYAAEAAGGGPLHSDLALLLFTSGSTGSPKAVRLSADAVAHNAEAIADSLSLTAGDRAFGHLALHYSYGMSIIHSHLARGGSVVLEDRALAAPGVWARARDLGATSLHGVPAHYALLKAMNFAPADICPTLDVMTQAGGKAPGEVLAHFRDQMRAVGGRFYVMYGQTEASPRIACHAISDEGAPTGAAGRALRGGRIDVVGEDGAPLPPGETGEVVYRGPNVMMGYGETREDLARGDEAGGRLATGDIGALDETGLLTLSGRSKRLVKLAGVRCNLDDLEAMAAEIGAPVAVAAEGDGAVVVWREGAVPDPRRAAAKLARSLRIPVSALTGRAAPELPTLASGKTDYAALARMTKED